MTRFKPPFTPKALLAGPMTPKRIYERDTDAVFIRTLRGSNAMGLFVAQRCGFKECDVVEVRGQQRHAADTGSIDIVVRLRGGGILLIENKIDAGYSITQAGHGQPERYRRSVATFRKAGTAAFSVLLAPNCYLASSRSKTAFDVHVAYEDLREFLSCDDRIVIERAIAQAVEPYEAIPNQGAGQFFASARNFIQLHYPDLVMKRDPNADGVRPDDSRTIYFDVPRTLHSHPGVPRPRMSLQCWDMNAPSASVKIMIGGGARLARHFPTPDDLADIGGYLRAAGQSLGIVIDSPRLDTQQPFADQVADVAEALNAALRLQKWWNDNGTLLAGWARALTEN